MAGQREHIASVGDHWRLAWRAGGPTALSPQVTQAIVSGGVPSHRRFELCPPVMVLVSSVKATRREPCCMRNSSLECETRRLATARVAAVESWRWSPQNVAAGMRCLPSRCRYFEVMEAGLSPAALDAAIRLLETGSEFRGEIMEAAGK